MRFLAATFDHAHPGSRGNYWAYVHPDLETVVLDKLYFEVVAPALRSHPDWAGLSELSGFATLGSRWACWFKRFDVGADLKGRSGRFVIACAFVERSEITGRDGSVILSSQQFVEIEQTARKHCPLPPMSALSITIQCSPARPVTDLLARLRDKHSWGWHGPDALTQLGSLAAFLPGDRELRAFVVQARGDVVVHAELLVEPPAKPVATTVPRPPLIKEQGESRQSPPPELRHTNNGSHFLRSRAIVFVLGLVVGLSFGIWLERRNAPRTQDIQELDRLSPTPGESPD